MKKTGTVVRVSSNIYDIESEGAVFKCKLRGKMHLKKESATRPVAIGDRVEFEAAGVGGDIIRTLDRNSLIGRADPHSPDIMIPICANVDTCVLFGSVKDPDFSFFEMDKCLVMVHRAKVGQIICLNKVDLVSDQDIDSIEATYKKIGYHVIRMSTKTGEGLDRFKEVIAGTTAVILGPTGAGKSSMINALNPNLELPTGKISRKLGKGKHTTTWYEIVDLGTAKCIDTPGVEGFNIFGVSDRDLQDYFPEFPQLKCSFPNCIHLNEKGCAVLEGVSSGIIAATRHASYLLMLNKIRSRRKY